MSYLYLLSQLNSTCSFLHCNINLRNSVLFKCVKAEFDVQLGVGTAEGNPVCLSWEKEESYEDIKGSLSDRTEVIGAQILQ